MEQGSLTRRRAEDCCKKRAQGDRGPTRVSGGRGLRARCRLSIQDGDGKNHHLLHSRVTIVSSDRGEKYESIVTESRDFLVLLVLASLGRSGKDSN